MFHEFFEQTMSQKYKQLIHMSQPDLSIFHRNTELADLSSWLCVHVSASSVSFLLSSFLIAQTLQCPLLCAAALTSENQPARDGV